MKKTTIYTAIQNILKDRTALTGLVLLIVASLATTILLLAKIQPSELQVSVHYTSFGGENIYRAQWFYLISFAVFGGMIAVLHSAIFIKIHELKGRNLALLFGYATIALLFIAVLLLQRVLAVASLT
ncbi:MAG: hypothetical protein ACTJG2_03555 [Candidatus Saccharimonadales bacterium]